MRGDLEGLLKGDHRHALREAESGFDLLVGGPRRPLVLHGAGEVGRNALAVLRREKVDVVAFVDNDPLKWGKETAGLPVLSAWTAASRYGQDAVFAVTYRCDEPTFERERARLRSLGAREVIPFSVLLRKWPEIAGWPYQSSQYYLERSQKVLAAFDLLADDESRRQFLGHFRWRLTRDYGALPFGELHDQYFRPEIIRLIDDECFVDGGAFDGDSIRTFLRERCERFRRIHAFEPDPRSYQSLQTFSGALEPELRDRISTWPYALADRRGEAHFTALGNHSSSLGGSSTSITVQTVALDDLLGEEPFTFLKLDLEGGEGPAISGAEDGIRRNRPIITVAVYHRPEDLFQIPLRLSEMTERYRFHIRSHNRYGLDLVLYAVPEERGITGTG